MSYIYIYLFCDECIAHSFSAIFALFIIIKIHKSSGNAVIAYMQCNGKLTSAFKADILLLLWPVKLQFQMLRYNIYVVINNAFTVHIIIFCGFDGEADSTETQLHLYWNTPTLTQTPSEQSYSCSDAIKTSVHWQWLYIWLGSSQPFS